MLNACSISKEIHEEKFIDLGIYDFLQQDSLISNAKNQYFEIFHHSLACRLWRHFQNSIKPLVVAHPWLVKQSISNVNTAITIDGTEKL